MKKRPYIPRQDDLKGGLDEIYYEMVQFVRLIKEKAPNETVSNALVESRLLHVRNLVELFKHKDHPDDNILATHYGFPRNPIEIDKYGTDLNKCLAHLTYSRVGVNQRWPRDKVDVPVLRRCIEFIDHILRERQSFAQTGPNNWSDLKQELQEELSRLSGRVGCLPPDII